MKDKMKNRIKKIKKKCINVREREREELGGGDEYERSKRIDGQYAEILKTRNKFYGPHGCTQVSSKVALRHSNYVDRDEQDQNKAVTLLIRGICVSTPCHPIFRPPKHAYTLLDPSLIPLRISTLFQRTTHVWTTR